MPVRDNPRDYTWGKRKKSIYLWIVIGAVLIVAVAITGYFVFQSETPKGSSTETEKSQSKTVRRALDGMEADRSVANLFPWAIMIENLSITRPQSGLGDAGVVYEALAEGGITRFLAIFATEKNIGDIGPVRSARPYYVDWASEYDGMYVHVGGSPQGLGRIDELNVRDINQFFNSGSFKYRKDKNPPHHMFTDFNLMTFTARDKEYPKAGDFESWAFKDDADMSSRPVEEQKITVSFSSSLYEVEYTYDRQTNTYLRSQGGAPFLDANTDTQIAPKNVIIQLVSIANFDEQRLDITTVGSGKAIIFRDGEAIVGTWEKSTASARTYFLDENGDEVELNAGQTWVEVVEKDRSNNYSY